MPFPTIHRVVTGHDADGRAIGAALPGTLFHEVWSTARVPATVVAREVDPAVGPIVLPPPAGGTRIRFVDIPPETPGMLAENAARMGEIFRQIGDASASTGGAGAPTR